jgi:SAM-dependent methyltransferase
VYNQLHPATDIRQQISGNGPTEKNRHRNGQSMPFRTFTDAGEAADYAASLDARWPERSAVLSHLSDQLAPSATAVVEFCAGAGALAHQLLQDHPNLAYTGIDLTPALLDVAHSRLAPYRGRVHLIEADLNQDGWLVQLPQPIHAFVSMQSLHDLGDAAAVARILRLAAARLAPRGQMIYADMLAVEPPEENTNPGRLSIARHLELLADAGFTEAACTWQIGAFGCFAARLP